MDPNTAGALITPPADQPMRAEVRAAGNVTEMLQAYGALVKGRPGWYQNEDEMEWYFYPSKVNETVSDQKTIFSEADYILPRETAQIDQYLAPLMQEMQSILQNRPEWHYDDGEKGWIYQQPRKPGLLRKIKSLF